MTRPPSRVVVLALAAAVIVAVAVLLALVMAGGKTDHPEDPEAFLLRVEKALRSLGEVPHVGARTTATDGQATYTLWSSEAWYAFESNAVRSVTRKAPGSSLDIADEVVVLRVKDDVYDGYPGTDDDAQRFSRTERPACLRGEPPLLAMGLLCGLGPEEGEAASLTVEGATEFRGERVRAVAAAMTDGRILRLLVDPGTYLPVAQTMTGESQPDRYVIETVFETGALPRVSLPSDFFDPRSIGYVPPEEAWLRILDAPDLGMPVYWPGRAMTGTGPHDARLTRVDDRRGPPGKETPGHVLSLDYEGDTGRFRLDYWPGDTWEAFLRLMGDGFLWSSCSDISTSTVPAGELTLLKGYEPEAGIEALRRPQVATPGTGPPGPEPAFNPFPSGCPAGDYTRFMAVVETDGGVVTINVPYGYCCQDGAAFGAFDREAALRAIAESLRLRQPGE